jgi:hypothetical protein
MPGVTYTLDVIDNITKVYRKIAGLSDKVEGGVNDVNKALKKTSRQGGINVFRLQRKFVAFERRLMKIPRRIQGGFQKLHKKLGGMGTAIAGYISARAVGDFVQGTLNAASDLEESTNKAKVTFGSYFSDIKRFSEGAADSIGMSKNQVLAASSTYAALYKNIGVGGKQVAKMSEASVRLAQDLASFNNMSTEDSLQALLSTLKGETEPALRFGVVLDEARIKAKALEMGLISTTKGALPKAIKTQAIYASIIEQTKDAQGDFQRTQGSYANQLKTLSANWGDLSAKMGNMFLPYAVKIQRWGISALNWIDKNSESIKQWAKWIGILGGSFLTLFAISKGILFIGHYIKIVKAAYASFMMVARLSPFGWIFTVVSVLIPLLISNWDTVKGWFIKFAQFMWKMHPFRWMIELIEKVFPGFKDQVKTVFDKVKNVLLDVGRWIYKNVIKPLFGWLVDLGILSEDAFSFGDSSPNIPAGGDRGAAYRNNSGNTGFDYNNGFGGGSGNAGNGTGNPIKNKINGLVEAGGKEMKNINISIDKLVETFNVTTQNIGSMSSSQIRREIERTLLAAVNDVNYSI